jgi:serine O-acetyltransferase
MGQIEVAMAHKSLAAEPQIKSYDPVWSQIRREAEEISAAEPALGGFIYATVIDHNRLEDAVCHRLARRLQHSALDTGLLHKTFNEVIAADPSLGDAFRADLMATVKRDPASARLIEPLLYFKGFHAIQTHRMAHRLWHMGRRDLALYLQSRSSIVFQCDINPMARLGRGIMIDHATGLVIGSTAVVEDDVSMLQDVTLGGTGKEGGDRHPKIRHGVLIGAGAKILGNIEIGRCSRVAAGSVVLHEVPPNRTVAGVPARIIGFAGCEEPSRKMDHMVEVAEDGE